MYFTIFSLAVAVIWVSIFAQLISIFRKHMFFLEYFSIYPLLIILMFCILRIIFPLELPYTTVIELKEFLSPVQIFLTTPFFDCNYIKISLSFILGTVWFLGAAVITVGRFRTYCHFRHFLNSLPAAKDERLYRLLITAKTKKQPKIIIHNAVESPAIVGCIHPIIILPDIEFEDEELLGIFIHEMAHYQSRHYSIKLVTEVIRICFWWNPLLKKLSSETAHALEMHADKTVCAKLTDSQQKKYLSGIIKVIGNISQPNISNVFSCSLVEETEEEKLKQRFKMILGNHYRNKRKYNFIIGFCVLTVFLLSYSFILQPYSEPTAADYGNTDTLTPDCGYYFIKTKNGYDLYEYPKRFKAHMTEIPDILKGMKIYKNIDEVKRK